MQNIELSIIIVDYNSHKDIIHCLESIKKYCLNSSYEIIIVDNNSNSDHSKEYKNINSLVRYLRLSSNKGFGSANNAGAKIATGKYLFLLNPDTLIFDDSIQKMVAFLKNHEEIGALTCLLYQKDKKTLQTHFFGKFQSLAGLTIRRNNYKKINLNQEYFYSDIVTAGALMIKKNIFEKINGFDEKIFLYLEDDDLCKRLVDLGYKNAVLVKAKIIHLEGTSTDSKSRKKFYYQSQNYYWQKHYGQINTLLMKIFRWPIKIIN